MTLEDAKKLIELQMANFSILNKSDENDWESTAVNMRNNISSLVYPLREMKMIHDYRVTYSVLLNYDDVSTNNWTSAEITFKIGIKMDKSQSEFNTDWQGTLTLYPPTSRKI